MPISGKVRFFLLQAVATAILATGQVVTVDTGNHASLWIRVEESGRQNASLALRRPAPAGLPEAFAEAVGCRAANLEKPVSGAYRPEVNCAPQWTRSGLSVTARWPLSHLNQPLNAAGVRGIDLYIEQSSGRGSNSRIITPGAMDSTRHLSGWTHHASMDAGAIEDVALETAFPARNPWVLLFGAIAALLSPLLLVPVRPELPSVQASVRWLSLIVGTGWLWTLLYTSAPALLTALAASTGQVPPGPWIAWAAAVTTALPTAAAVWLGSSILRAKYGRFLTPQQVVTRHRQLIWGGIACSGMLVLLVALLTMPGGDLLIPLVTVGMGGLGAGLIQRLRAARAALRPMQEGPLLERVRQLAAKAGAPFKGLQLICRDSDTPAAFARHDGTILLSQALLRELSCVEVDAIVAHELSHLARHHGAQMRGVLAVLPLGVGVSLLAPDLLVWTPVLLPTAFLAFMGMRRQQEFAADADAALWCGSGGPEALVRGLARACRTNRIPLKWGRCAGLALPHPPTSARFAAVAAKAGWGPGRLEEVAAAAGSPPEIRYEVPPPLPGSTGGSASRERLKLWLGILGLIFPVLYSVLVPMALPAGVTGISLLALAGGITLFYLLYEAIVARVRADVRREMLAKFPEDPGIFGGFNPASEPALYGGMYDFDWGFASFEGDRLVYRGGCGVFSARREEIARVWLDPGPASWTAKPMLSLELIPLDAGAQPRGFSVRPFDGAFGPFARRAAQRLFDEATAWHRREGGSTSGSQQPPPLAVTLYEFPRPPRQPDAALSYASLVKELGRSSVYVMAGGGFVQVYFQPDQYPGPLFTSLFVLWGLVLFQAWPAIRRSKRQS